MATIVREIGARLLALCSEGSMCYDVITWMSSWTIALLLDPLYSMLKLIFIEIWVVIGDVLEVAFIEVPR